MTGRARSRVQFAAEAAVYLLVALFAALLIFGPALYGGPDEPVITPPGTPAEPCRAQRPGVCPDVVGP